MRISDWSSDVCSSDLNATGVGARKRLMPASWIEALDQVAKPIIAAIHGACMGGGMELALACDLRIAAENARFALPETKLGLLPGGGGTQRLPRLIGLARALDMLISGKTIDAALALEWGIVTRVAGSAQEALDQAIALAEQIATRPQLAIAYVKEADRKSNTSELQSLMRISYAVFCLKKKKTQQQKYIVQ